MLQGKIKTHASNPQNTSQFRPKTSQVTVDIRATYEELKEIHNQEIVILTEKEYQDLLDDLTYQCWS